MKELIDDKAWLELAEEYWNNYRNFMLENGVMIEEEFSDLEESNRYAIAKTLEILFNKYSFEG